MIGISIGAVNASLIAGSASSEFWTRIARELHLAFIPGLHRAGPDAAQLERHHQRGQTRSGISSCTSRRPLWQAETEIGLA
ncbi:hypothetical protein EV560_116135 [Bosea sp. BK604]|nr:hypothetical protein EV560_116135 [Bosea sp. BK604]